MSLRELLETLVKRARELRYSKDLEMASLIRKTATQPNMVTELRKTATPTSHFHVMSEFESLLSTLELNFFLTKYSEMSDRDGRKVSVFAYNFGLCQRLNIEFGKPRGTDYRHYFVDRVFDYTPILQKYLEVNQEIICDHCQFVFGFNELPILRRYRMKCPECSIGTCQVINLSKKYESTLNTVDKALLLPQTELGILQTLKTESTPMLAAEIAANLDCSYQLVGKRGKILAERGLVQRTEAKGRRQFKLTKTAEEMYFSDNEKDDLDY